MAYVLNGITLQTQEMANAWRWHKNRFSDIFCVYESQALNVRKYNENLFN